MMKHQNLTISHAKTGIQFRSLLLDFSVEIPDKRHIVLNRTTGLEFDKAKSKVWK